MASAIHRPAEPARGFDIGWLLIASLFVVADLIVWVLFKAGSDWAPLWAAGQIALSDPARIFDFSLITSLQAPLTGSVEFRPYVYPPSALLIVAPISILPFWTSFGLVLAGSLACLGAGGRRIGSDLPLLFLAPPVVIAAIVGQISLCVIGLVVLACASLEKRERAAGVLFAVAALIKPTLLILAPIGLVAGRHWHALAAAMVTGLAGFAASLILFGIQPWFDWLVAMPRFQQLLAGYEPLIRNSVSPFGFAVLHGFEHWAIIGVGAAVSAIMAWKGFVQPADAGTRSALLIGGALLLTPYAMNYELAAFAPFLLALPRNSARNLLACGVWAVSLFFNAGVIGLLAAYVAAAAPVVRAQFQTRSEDVTSRA